MTKQLTTQNATITTAAVEVKALTISGRQVTQSVFRQLRSERLVADDGTLRGTPWGHVNHCPDRKVWDSGEGETIICAEGPTHLHVVWQKDAELRRARVTPPPTWWSDLDDDACSYFVQAAYCANDHKVPDWARTMYRHGTHDVAFRFDGMGCSSESPDSPTRSKENHDCCAGEVEAAKSQLADAIIAERARRDRQHSVWRSLTDLPQLFIAV